MGEELHHIYVSGCDHHSSVIQSLYRNKTGLGHLTGTRYCLKLHWIIANKVPNNYPQYKDTEISNRGQQSWCYLQGIWNSRYCVQGQWVKCKFQSVKKHLPISDIPQNDRIWCALMCYSGFSHLVTFKWKGANVQLVNTHCVTYSKITGLVCYCSFIESSSVSARFTITRYY